MWNWKDCQAESLSRGAGWLRRCFICVPVMIDRWWRHKDFEWNRSHDGMLSQLLGIKGYPPVAILLPALALFWMVYGPTAGWRGWVAVVIVGMSILVLCVGARSVANSWMMPLQLVIVAVVGLVVWQLGQPHSQLDPAIYRHVLPFAFATLIAAPAALAHLVAWATFRSVYKHRALFRSLLEQVDVFVNPRYPDASVGAIWRSLISAPLRYPLHLVFLPAIIVLCCPFWFLGGQPNPTINRHRKSRH